MIYILPFMVLFEVGTEVVGGHFKKIVIFWGHFSAEKQRKKEMKTQNNTVYCGFLIYFNVFLPLLSFTSIRIITADLV